MTKTYKFILYNFGIAFVLIRNQDQLTSELRVALEQSIQLDGHHVPEAVIKDEANWLRFVESFGKAPGSIFVIVS